MRFNKKKIKDFGTVTTGKTPPTKQREYFDGDYLFVTPTDLEYNNYYIYKTNTTVTEQARNRFKNQFIPKDSIIYTCIGNTIGKIAISPSDCLTNQQINSITPNAENNFLFIYYYLIYITPQIRQLGGGVATPIVNKSSFESIDVSVPNIDTQEKIASILSAYDDLIENNLKRIKLLEEAAQLLYRQWFVDFKFPGHEKIKFIKGIPEGWEEKPLSEVCYLTMGQSPESIYYNQEGKGLPFHQGVTNYGFRFVTHEIYCTQENRIAEQGDILCSVRAPVGRLNISLDRIVIGRGLSAIRNKDGFQSFQYYQLKKYFFQEDLIGSGAIFASVTKKQMETIPLLTPTKDILSEFERIVKIYDGQIINLFYQNQRLKEARDILLPRLMDGSIEV